MNEQNNNKPIYVTQPTLAPLEEYQSILKNVWASGILTHNGPVLQQFEQELADKIGVEEFIAVTNGTVAIQMAIKALELKGEIITTPFSWVATISAINWEGCTPIFCDINPGTLNIDVNKIESLITDKTVAIMPVHVFGNPCDLDDIDRLAKKHNLKIIYDAAHAIGSTYKGKSVFEWGDISATSLHATKLLNTAEGGGCVASNKEITEKLKRIRFFGHDENKNIVEDGFNGKMTEVHAALGLANLKYFDDVLEDRKQKYHFYQNKLKSVPFIRFQKLEEGCNYSYFPVIFDTEERLLSVEKKMNENDIFPRRYFFPSLNTLEKIVAPMSTPISEDVSKRVMCLPLYFDLTQKEMFRVIDAFV